MSVDHFLAMAFDGPTMDDDLRMVLAAHEIVLGDEWADGRPRLGVVRVTEVDEGLEQRPRTGDAVRDVKKNWGSGGQFTTQGWFGVPIMGDGGRFPWRGGVPLRRRQCAL